MSFLKKDDNFKVIRGQKNKLSLKKIIFILAIILFVLVAGKRVFKIIEQNKKIEELQFALEKEKIKNSELLEKIEYLKSPRGIEEIAREELGLVKEGEMLIRKAIIINPESKGDKDD